MPLFDKITEALTYDDVSLVPCHSKIKSRKQPKTTCENGRERIIVAPMNTIAEEEMTEALSKIGVDTVLHRYATIERQVEMFKEGGFDVWAAIGASGDFLERAEALYEAGCRKFCVDIANGHSQVCVEAVTSLRNLFGDKIDIMAGNVCTGEGALTLEEAGANYIRVGVGPGSACSTRLVTGFGVPQLTAVASCAESVKNALIVADGGIRSSGDAVKAFAAGADFVMLGGLLAGTAETPGHVQYELDEDGNKVRPYKIFAGMASEYGRSEFYSKEATSFVPEGASMKVSYNGISAVEIMNKFIGGIKVGMSFANATNIKELQNNVKFVKVTTNGKKEGNPNLRMHK